MKVLGWAVLSSLVLSHCGRPEESRLGEAPPPDNEPSNFGIKDLKLDTTMTKYARPVTPWPGDYWPTIRGGISFRWKTQKPETQDKKYQDFLYPIMKKKEVDTLTSEKIATLSPAEKYDLWMGRTDFGSSSLTSYERDFTLDAAKKWEGKVPTWIGICNGWSLASVFVPAPRKPVVTKGPNGQTVKFYPDDIKALASLVYNEYQEEAHIYRIGNRCSDKKYDSKVRSKKSDCRDINPMSMHLALTRYFAQGGILIADVDPGVEIWNNPVAGFSIKYESVKSLPADYKYAAANAKKIIHVETIMTYTDEIDPKESELTVKELQEAMTTMKLSYTLELDEDLKIVGGEWDLGSEHPDFLWYTDDTPNSTNMPKDLPISLEKLNLLIAHSQ